MVLSSICEFFIFLKKIALICNPLVIALLGNLANLIADGLDSGFESLGWLLMYLVCAFALVKRMTMHEFGEDNKNAVQLIFAAILLWDYSEYILVKAENFEKPLGVLSAEEYTVV